VKNLHLTLLEAALAEAKYSEPRQLQCELNFESDPTRPPLGPCLATGSAPRVLLWGDSYALHWSPALDWWADRSSAHAEIEYLTSRCQPLLGATSKNGSCAAHNDLVAERIRLAGDHRPAGIFISALWRFSTAPLEELNDTLRLVASNGLRAVVVLQSPTLAFPSGASFSGPECILRRGPQNCSMPLQQYRTSDKHINDTISRIASEFNNVRIFDPAVDLCPDQTCSAMIDDIVVYKDNGHLTSAISRKLAERLAPDLDWLIGADDTGR
jgi:hypothetical protein